MMTESQYLQACRKQLLADLKYPVGRDGSVVDCGAVADTVAHQLIRCGWRKPNNRDGLALIEAFDEPLIKARKVYGPGMFDDAITWIDVNEPDDPLADIANMTMKQIAALPADLCLEAKRRLGIEPQPAEPQPGGWSVQTHITISDEPDVDDGTTWKG
jgi:hypothetical protein